MMWSFQNTNDLHSVGSLNAIHPSGVDQQLLASQFCDKVWAFPQSQEEDDNLSLRIR